MDSSNVCLDYGIDGFCKKTGAICLNQEIKKCRRVIRPAAYYGLGPDLSIPPPIEPGPDEHFSDVEHRPSPTPARVLEWREFSQHMEAYIADNTVEKYGDKGQDPMTDTDAHIIHWNLRRYATRLFRGFGKPHDLEKIAHYAAMAWAKKEAK